MRHEETESVEEQARNPHTSQIDAFESGNPFYHFQMSFQTLQTFPLNLFFLMVFLNLNMIVRIISNLILNMISIIEKITYMIYNSMFLILLDNFYFFLFVNSRFKLILSFVGGNCLRDGLIL